MSSPWHRIDVLTHQRIEVQDITDRVLDACPLPPNSDGLLVAICAHTTAGLCINEAEAGLMSDLEAWLERLVPASGRFAHNAIDTNADAHLRSIVLGHSICLPIIHGALGAGQWQRILFVECDGPRKRQILAKVVGS